MPLQPGQILNNRYRIERLLGQGGFGAVYLATDRNLNAAVAIKESLDTSPASEKQFRSEAGLLFKLHHTNLPRVHDCFAVAGQGLYLAMDYIEGESLERKLEQQGGPLPVEQVLAWIGPICDALDYLHRQAPPVIHRDIKPANILLTRRGGVCDMVKVLDFGLVKAVNLGPKGLAANAIVGTPHFMAPEAISNPETVDPRSDIYSLGAVGYWLLTGKTLFDTADVDLLLEHQVKDQPAPPSALMNQADSTELHQVIMRCLAKNPSDRPASVQQLGDAIARCKADKPWLPPEAERWWHAHLAGLETVPAAVMPQKTLVIAPRPR